MTAVSNIQRAIQAVRGAKGESIHNVDRELWNLFTWLRDRGYVDSEATGIEPDLGE